MQIWRFRSLKTITGLEMQEKKGDIVGWFIPYQHQQRVKVWMHVTESLVRQFEYVGVEGFLMWFVSTCPL